METACDRKPRGYFVKIVRETARQLVSRASKCANNQQDKRHLCYRRPVSCPVNGPLGRIVDH
jgi:hypothetical protein